MPVHFTDLYGKNYLTKPQLPDEFDEYSKKYRKIVDELPKGIYTLMDSYHIVELLINKSKNGELSNEELELLKKKIDLVVSLSERLTAQENHAKSR